MKKKTIFKALGAVFLVFIVIILLGGIFSDKLLDLASKSSGRNIETSERIRINWGWPITSLDAQNIKIENFSKGSDPTMLSMDSLHASINLFSILKGDLFLPEIIMKNPNLLLEKDVEGNANWNITDNAAGGVAAEAASPDDRSDFPIIGRLIIEKGKVAYKDPKTKTDLLLEVDTVMGKTPSNQNLHFNGKGRYQDQDFTMVIDGGNVFQLKDTNDPYPLRVDLKAGNTSAKVEGTVLDPFKLKGVDLALILKGQDASDLFTLIGVALPPTPPYDLKGQLHYKDDKWAFEEFSGKMGDSDLRGNVTWDTSRERPLLSGEFISDTLDFDDLGGFIGATPSVKSGETASQKQKNEAAADVANPYVIPDTPLDISRLSAMDAKVTFTGKKLISSSLPLDDFFMDVELDDRLLKVKPVRFGTAKGDITIFLDVNARVEPVQIKGDFAFRKLMLKPIFEKLAATLGTKNVTDGYIGGAAKLEGTGKSLRQMLATANGNVGLGMEGGQLSNLLIELVGLDVAQSLGFFLEGDKPVPVRCMIGDFAVKNGLMDVRRFVIDTKDSNINGKGTINLKDEKMDMVVQAEPKDTSIVSLNSPIGIKGTLKNPDIDLNLVNIAARGAVATAGAIIFAPLAALAFIEPGLGKDSNCAKFVSDMEKRTKEPGEKSLIPKNKKMPETK